MTKAYKTNSFVTEGAELYPRSSAGMGYEGRRTMRRVAAVSAAILSIVLFLAPAGHALERKIYLEGEFLFPGEHSFSEGERLGSIIEKAGGLTPEAYPFGAIFMRESAKKVQQGRMKEYADKLEEDILASTAQSAETALDKDQAVVLQQNLEAKKQLLEKLRKAKATGRVVIDLEEVLVLPSSAFNFELRPGDRLVVPKRPYCVNVMCEVYNPTALFAEKDKGVDYYLSQVGGPGEEADMDQIYVVRANGSVISRSQGRFFGMVNWDTDKKRWIMGGFDSMTVVPGDTIIVPRKTVEYPLPGTVKSVTEIMYQIAVTAGVLVVAF